MCPIVRKGASKTANKTMAIYGAMALSEAVAIRTSRPFVSPRTMISSNFESRICSLRLIGNAEAADAM
jgi:hypothetical protein